MLTESERVAKVKRGVREFVGRGKNMRAGFNTYVQGYSTLGNVIGHRAAAVIEAEEIAAWMRQILYRTPNDCGDYRVVLERIQEGLTEAKLDFDRMLEGDMTPMERAVLEARRVGAVRAQEQITRFLKIVGKEREIDDLDDVYGADDPLDIENIDPTDGLPWGAK